MLNTQLNQIKLFSILLQLQSAIFKYPVVNPIKPFCKLLQSQNVNASVSLLEKKYTIDNLNRNHQDSPRFKYSDRFISGVED